MTLRQKRAERIRELAQIGKTRQQVADELLMSYHTIVLYGRAFDIQFRRASTPHANASHFDARADAMVAMFTAGQTLESVGALYGITRERVRQIIKKQAGIVGKDGGKAKRGEARRERARLKKEAKCQARWGCSVAEYKGLRAVERAMMDAGKGYYQTPRGAFTTQRYNSKFRNIEWKLTLWQWWTVWCDSGKWEQRGRGRSYMMCRFGDAGPYEMGNVYIATGVHNASIQPNNPNRKSHPNHAAHLEARAAA